MNIGQSYFPNLPKQGRICFPLNRGLTGSVVLSNTIGPLINGIQPGFSPEMSKLLKLHHLGKPNDGIDSLASQFLLNQVEQEQI